MDVLRAHQPGTADYYPIAIFIPHQSGTPLGAEADGASIQGLVFGTCILRRNTGITGKPGGMMNHQWRIAARPHGRATEADFQWAQEAESSLKDGEIRVRIVYLSLDPTNRFWMEPID